MQHYFAVLEPAASGALHITFPGLDGVGSFAERHTDIVQQASDALESALMVGRGLPLSIEEGARVPLNLAGYDNPLVVVIPFGAPPPKDMLQPVAEPAADGSSRVPDLGGHPGGPGTALSRFLGKFL